MDGREDDRTGAHGGGTPPRRDGGPHGAGGGPAAGGGRPEAAEHGPSADAGDPSGEARGPSGEECGLLDAGPLLRPFALRAGRPPVPASPRPSARTPAGPLTAVRAADPSDADREPYPEVAAVLRACAKPRRVIDLAAEAGLPLTVARHLVRDLAAEGRLVVCHSRPADDRDILEHVLEGLRAL
nr:DUF742 domain-containing protein [Nocardiopsis chromatogenes]